MRKRKEPLVLLPVDDPADRELPAMGHAIFTAADGSQVEVDTDDPAGRAAFRKTWEHNRNALLAVANRLGILTIPLATGEDVHWTQRMFAASGLAVVMDEELMDAVTGLSGTGPAYLFYLVEAMTAAGIAEGMDPDVAEMLATQTCIGAGKLLAHTKKPPEDLRAQVTTPNGTTQRAMETLDAAGVKDKIVEAVRAATERSRELGR